MIIQDFLGNEFDIDCMGCAISDGSMAVPGGFIRNTQHFIVHQDPLIPLSGFLVIASQRHIQSVSEMQDAEYEDFTMLIRATHRAIKEVTNVEYLTTVQEDRSRHFHLWFFPWTQRVIKQFGPPSLTRIRPIIADYSRNTIGDADWEVLEKEIKMLKVHLS